MRKSIVNWAVVMAVAAMAAGCQKSGLEITPEEPAVEPERTDGLPKGAYRLTTEGDEGGTKTLAIGNQVNWVEGDVVNVNGNDYAIKQSNGHYYIEPGADGTPLITGDKIYGYYNCGDVYNKMTTNPKVTIPLEYECTVNENDSKAKIALPMAAYGDRSAGTIQFKQLTAALSLTITNSTGFPLRLDEVTLIGNDKILSGSTWLYFNLTDYGLESQNGSSTVALHIKGTGVNNTCYISNGGSVTVQVPFLPVNNASVNILVRANSHYAAVIAKQNHNSDFYSGVPNTDYEFRYSYTPDAKLTLGRNQMMTASVTLKRAAESNGRVTEVDHGLFSVSGTKQVRFSMGNLRYQATADHNKWTFHEHQYDIVGSDNRMIDASYSGYIDLFGWATSGYDDYGQICYQPWSTSNNANEYYHGGGSWSVEQSGVRVPTKLDWAYNLISENQYNAFNWQTPSKTMWEYIMERDNKNKWGNGTVNGLFGCILLPDDWVQPYGVPNFTPKNIDNYYNIYTADQWAKMEKAGAVFLPTAGERDVKAISKVGEYGNYWTSSPYADNLEYAYYLSIGAIYQPLLYLPLFHGYAVRLVAYVN